jgi:hypothetical protein
MSDPVLRWTKKENFPNRPASKPLKIRYFPPEKTGPHWEKMLKYLRI